MIGAVGDDQRRDYAVRRGMTADELQKWLRWAVGKLSSENAMQRNAKLTARCIAFFFKLPQSAALRNIAEIIEQNQQINAIEIEI